MASDLERKLDYSDYLATPDDGRRYEVLEGRIYVTPSPSSFHQRLSKRLGLQLIAHFEGHSLGEVFDAPLDVILGHHDIVQPDLLVVTDPGQVSARGVEGAPLLVVEILSPSTGKRDRELKARRYAELGVRHYWLADPEDRRVQCYRLEAGVYRSVVEGTGDGRIVHPDLDGFVLDLTALWQAPDYGRSARGSA